MTTKTDWFESKLSRFENDLEFLTGEKILDFNEKLVNIMQENGVNRAELAKRLGVSRPFVTKLLNGNPNMTIKTMVHLAHVINCNLHLDICPKYVQPKTLCVIPNSDNYKEFHLKGEFEYASAA